MKKWTLLLMFVSLFTIFAANVQAEDMSWSVTSWGEPSRVFIVAGPHATQLVVTYTRVDGLGNPIAAEADLCTLASNVYYLYATPPCPNRSYLYRVYKNTTPRVLASNVFYKVRTSEHVDPGDPYPMACPEDMIPDDIK